MLIKFFQDFGYFKTGKEYDIDACAAEFLLKNSFSCYNSEMFENQEVSHA